MYEKKKDAALREVMEETGVKGVSIVKKLRTTRHLFKTQNHPRSIKKTYWYLMKTEKQKLIPQTEEDITKATWMRLQKFNKLDKPVFKNIIDVLESFEKKYLNKSH